MSTLAPTLQAFFTERLLSQRRASPGTVSSYRDSLRMLLVFVKHRTGKDPSQLDICDIDVDLVSAFLNHLELERRNSSRTRNTRLAAIRSLFRYAALRHPEYAGCIQRVLAIPTKRYDRKMVNFLNHDEVNALLLAPDRSTFIGRRDHTLLLLAIQTGLRVSEITSLTCADIELDSSARVRCIGKGRKERVTPVIKCTAVLLRSWMQELASQPTEPLFPTVRGTRMSADAVQRVVAKHAASAAENCKSISSKQVSPHVLRHTCAMNLLQSGVDISVIALWLGHEHIQTTQIYLHADLNLKEKALALITPLNSKSGRYKAPDELLAFLDRL